MKVVSAVILRDDRVLLQQRAPKRDYPWTWECPGGKMEEGENPVGALSRELIEEVGLLLSDGTIEAKAVYETMFRPPEVKKEFNIEFHVVEPRRGWMPQLHDGVGLGWFTWGEMKLLTLTPGNGRLVFHLSQRDGFRYLTHGRWRR